jgi:hypothetical protein
MSEIKKYKKYLNFKANPRYLTRDFIVPLYTGTEPDILDDSNTQRESSVYKEFPNDMPIVSPKEIQNQPYEQLELADGGRVGGARFGYYKKIGDKNIKKPTHTIQGNKWPDKETKNFYEEQIKERFKYAKNSNELLKKYESGKLLTNEQLAKKYNVSIPVIKRINKTVVKDLELENKPVIGREESLKKTDIERKKAQLKYSNRYFEQKVKGSYKAHLGHMGDLYNRIVTGKNLGYTPVEINQAMSETLDPILRGISEAQDKLIENKPPGWKKKLRLYNQKGINYSSLAEGYKSFDIINPNTLEKYTYGVDYLKTIDPAALYKGKPIKEIAQLTDKDELNKIQRAFDNLTEAKKIARRKGLEQADISKIKNSELLTEENLRKLQNFKAFEENREAVLKAQSKIPVSKTFKTQMITKISKIKDQMIANMGCPTLTSKSIGGRVNFSNGSNCYIKGLEKIQSGELGNAERRIASQFLKEAGVAGEDVQDVFKGTKAGLRFLQDVVVGLTRPVIAANVGISAAAEGENLLRGQLNPVSRVVESVTFGALGGGPTEVADQMLEFGSPGTIKTINHSKTIKKFNDQIESEKNDIENANYTYAEYGIDPTNVILEKEKNIANIEKQKNEFLSNPTFVLTQKDKNDFENDFKKIVRIGLDKGIEGTKKTARFTPEIQATSNEILIDRERFPNFASQLATNLKGTEIENILKPYSDIEKSIIDESTFIAKDPGLLEIKNYYQDFKNAGDIIYNKSEPLTDEQRIGIEEMGARGGAADGGRIGLSEGGGPKIGRRGFLGLIAGAAAAPDLIKSIKGTGQAAKIASKIKIEPAEGMYPWFPKLVEKIKDMGKPFEEKQLIMEPSYKNDPRPFGSRQPTGEEKLTKHVDGDTTFILREYPDGRLAVDIDSPRNQQSFGQPVSLYYRPKMEFQNYKGEKKIEPPEFKVLEPEPRPFVSGPDDVDITFTEVPKNPKRNTVFGDIEAAERFATGNIKNRKIIPVKQSLRNEMEEDPSTFIMRESGELGSKARPEEIIKKTEEFATGGRVGFSGGGGVIKFARMITDLLKSLKQDLSFSSHLVELYGPEAAKKQILSPYRIPEGTNKSQQSDILTRIDEIKQNLPKEYSGLINTLDDIEKNVNDYNYIDASKKGTVLLDKLPDSFNFEKLPQNLFPMEDPLNDAFILFDPKREKMVGRYTMRYNIDPETNKGIIQTYDTYDPISKKFLEEKDWKLIGVDAREESGAITKEGLN